MMSVMIGKTPKYFRRFFLTIPTIPFAVASLRQKPLQEEAYEKDEFPVCRILRSFNF